MKLRTKVTLFFGSFFLVTVVAVVVYVEYVVGDTFRKQIASDFFVIAEQSEGTYFAFMEGVKTRAVDWTSDVNIQNTVKGVLGTVAGTPERARFAKEFATYISERKMPYDKTIFLVDVLDRDGIVVASTRPDRIGTDELEEEVRLKAHHFSKAIVSESSEVLVRGFIFEEDETAEPMTHAAVRLFILGKDGVFQPLDAVLLIHFANTRAIAHALGVGEIEGETAGFVTNRVSRQALLKNYKTSDIYLVNSDSTMVTPSRYVKDVNLRQKVDTLPVRECLEKGEEISGEYDDYRGVRVFGASMCFKDDELVLVVETQKDELFAPLYVLIRTVFAGGFALLVFGVLVAVFFVRKPLARIGDVVAIAKRVTEGDYDARVNVQTKDELGYLGTSFNRMIVAIRSTQKQLQASKHKVEEEEAKDEALLASLGEGMIATDNEGKIIKLNHAAEKILNLRSADVIGKKAVEVVEALDESGKEIPEEQRPISMVPASTATVSRKMSYRRKDDGYSPVAVTVTPVVIEGKVIGSIEIFRDITKEKEIEKTRTDLLSLASHQLRTPLSGTKWLIETLKRGIHGPLTAGQTEYLDELYKINERMTTLVHDMLGVLRIEGDQSQIKKESISAKDILATVFETLHGVAEDKQMTIRLPENAELAVNTDPLLLRNILESLVANAITYSGPGREVFVSVEQKEDSIVFSIKDSGIGIPRDEQRQIFERFYRASNAKTFDTRGSGLGLYIATMLAKKIGARLSFESEEGKGSTFFIHLPR